MIAYPIIGYTAGAIFFALLGYAICKAAKEGDAEEDLAIVAREEREEVERSVGGRRAAVCVESGPVSAERSRTGAGAPLSFDCEPRTHRREPVLLPARRGEL